MFYENLRSVAVAIVTQNKRKTSRRARVDMMSDRCPGGDCARPPDSAVTRDKAHNEHNTQTNNQLITFIHLREN